MAKILLVEDDEYLVESVENWLGAQNHVVDSVNTGKQAIHNLKTYTYEVVLLDIGLPDIDGYDVLKTFRKEGGLCPVIFLTGKNSIKDKMLGLDSGADDYITKPFDLNELSARIRAVLRRSPNLGDNVLEYHGLVLDTAKLTLKRNDQVIKLSSIELSLMEFLLRNPEQVFSAQTLIDRVWTSYSDVSPESVRTYITRLRSKIDIKGENSYIQSVYGAGYKLQKD